MKNKYDYIKCILTDCKYINTINDDQGNTCFDSAKLGRFSSCPGWKEYIDPFRAFIAQRREEKKDAETS